MAHPALAARGFGSTYGSAGTGESIKSGYTTAASNTVSISVWIVLHGYGQGGFGELFTQTNGAGQGTNYSMLALNSISGLSFGPAFNTTGGGFSIALATATSWKHLCITYDGTSVSNVPIIYLNGVSQTVTTRTTPVGSFASSASNLYIGSNRGANSNFDGKIADFAQWNGQILTANECKALASGASPMMIRKSGLSVYLPLFGVSGEPEWITRATQTVTGTAFQPDPPISRFTPQGG